MIANVIALLLSSLASAAAAQSSPAFLLEPMLDIYFDERSGLIAFHGNGYDLAFPPDEPLQAVIAVVDDTDTVVQSFPFRPEYGNRTANGAIARALVQQPAEITLTDPGVYNIVFMIDGQLVSRLPVALEQVEIGDAPFERETHLRYFGLWERYAYLSMDTWQGEDWPQLTFWAGLRDFEHRAHALLFLVELERDGERVAHSKRTQGSIPFKHYERIESRLYHPHDQKSSPNARPFLAADWTRDGEYTLSISRQSDGQVIRRFAYTASNGLIQPRPETRLGHEPSIDYRAPRVRDKSSTGYDFTEAIWLGPAD